MLNKKNVIVSLALVAVLGYIVVSSMSTGKVSCEVCIIYKGRESCRSARGPTQEDAIVTARDNACALIVSGRTDNILCGGSQPASVSCSE